MGIELTPDELKMFESYFESKYGATSLSAADVENLL